MKEIADIYAHYEQFKVRFKGERKWYFMTKYMLIGVKLKGKLVKKRTRTWFE